MKAGVAIGMTTIGSTITEALIETDTTLLGPPQRVYGKHGKSVNEERRLILLLLLLGYLPRRDHLTIKLGLWVQG